jgi:hypothetical protein
MRGAIVTQYIVEIIFGIMQSYFVYSVYCSCSLATFSSNLFWHHQAKVCTSLKLAIHVFISNCSNLKSWLFKIVTRMDVSWELVIKSQLNASTFNCSLPHLSHFHLNSEWNCISQILKIWEVVSLNYCLLYISYCGFLTLLTLRACFCVICLTVVNR